MNSLSIRLPNYLHEKVRELAERENVSINQFISLALAEKIAALMTEEYIEKRAARANKDSFEAAMKKVADREALDEDRL